MCFHNALTIKAKDLEHRYKAVFGNENHFEPIYHASAFSHRKWPVITNNEKDKINEFSWGLIPSWTKTTEDANKIKNYTLNAVSETAFDKPSFRKSIAGKRCLVPSTGFFEWQSVHSKKYPYFINLKSCPTFSMAGLWDEWTDIDTGEIIKTFSILTTKANSLMERIHNTKKRMPVILTPENENEWLNNNMQKEDILSICKPISEDIMQAHSVSKLVSSKKEYTNQPEVQKPYIYPELSAGLAL